MVIIMKIEASTLLINLKLKHENEFLNLKNYETSKDCEYLLETKEILPTFEEKTLDFKTTYYDMYKTNLGMLQVQKGVNNNIGYILYNDKKCYLYLVEDSFNTEYLLSQYVFVYWIRKYTNSLFIHSSSVSYNDLGILFCAKSGTGKSTQRRLWERHGALCINDDKNVISLIDGKLYINTNPWCGKHFVSFNKKVELTNIVYLYQNKENKPQSIDEFSQMKFLLGQIQLPSKEFKDSWNKIIDMMLQLNNVSYGCNMELSAFTTLYKYIKGE